MGKPVAASETQTPRSSDFELAQRAAEGDMNSFEELYQRHNRRVYSLCLRMTGNVTEAEDLAQEVFIQLFRKIGSFRGESAFTTWLHRLTVNQVLMHFRKRGVRLEQTTEDGEAPIQIVKGTENPNAMPVVDRIALDKAIAQWPCPKRYDRRPASRSDFRSPLRFESAPRRLQSSARAARRVCENALEPGSPSSDAARS